MNYDKKASKYASYDFKDRHDLHTGTKFYKKRSHKLLRQHNKKLINEQS